METLVYIHLASAYEAAGATENPASTRVLKVSQHKVNWKTLSRKIGVHLLSFAIASLGLGMAGQAMATLRQGSKGPEVSELQQQLRQLGYFNRRATGSFGPITKTAVIKFQQDLGLTPNGIVETETQQALQNKIGGSEKATPGSPDNRPTLRKGSKGSQVSYLQQLLTDAGVYDGQVNGVFDSPTNTAVKQFQRSSSLAVDGIVGKRTWTTLAQGDAPTANQPFDNSPFTNQTSPQQGFSEPVTTPVLRVGDRGTAVSTLQKRLRDLGYFKSSPTGGFGSVTKAAVIRFQRDNGLRANGIVEQKTQAALQNTGSSGNFNVSELQKRLQEKNFYRGPIDGNFNAQTKAAVKEAQRAYGIDESDILKVKF